MRMKFKLAAITSATMLAGTIGVLIATPALANDNIYMCNFDSKSVELCMYAHGSGPSIGMDQYKNGVSAVELNAPTSGKGQISLDGTSTCLEVGSSDSIVVATCAGKSAEEWTATETPDKGLYKYKNASDNLCLNDKYYDSVPNVAACSSGASNANEDWSVTGSPQS